jgi:hypothetical protein
MERIAESLQNIADALKGLGLNGAFTEMGAIELLAREIQEGSEKISQGIFDGLYHIAEAIRDGKGDKS